MWVKIYIFGVNSLKESSEKFYKKLVEKFIKILVIGEEGESFELTSGES